MNTIVDDMRVDQAAQELDNALCGMFAGLAELIGEVSVNRTAVEARRLKSFNFYHLDRLCGCIERGAARWFGITAVATRP